MSSMDNPEALRAQQIIEFTGTNLFLTGKAGTGKTTFLKRLHERSPKRMVVLAPTGIAAINAGGVTLHSFFQLPFAPYVPEANYSRETFKLNKMKVKLIRSLDLVVIDEISMVRADLLDAVDAVLRRYRDRSRPFGGVQLLLIGDLQQLAPVVKDEEWALLSRYYDTPFFFGSRALRQTDYVTIELRHVYRQSDSRFIDLLNKVREGRVDAAALQALNSRYVPGFRPDRSEGYVRLVTHNHQARQINEAELDRLPTPAFGFKAEVSGVFPESAYPTDSDLVLKKGAQVMFVKNDPEKRFFNGMLGEVTAVAKSGFSVRPLEPQGAAPIDVVPEEWTNAKYVLNEETKEIEEKVEGVFRQYPVRAAWAITIHKSQGLTFERAIIDTQWAFAHGQTYVALSRCKSLEGMVLSAPIPPQAIICDASVADYTAKMVAQSPSDEAVGSLERTFYAETLVGLFSFTRLRYAVDALRRLLAEHFYRLYPEILKQADKQSEVLAAEVEEVARKFRVQLDALLAASTDYAADAHLHDRLRKGAVYFAEHLEPLEAFAGRLQLPTDNKVVQRRVTAALDELRQVARLQLRLLRFVAHEGFELQRYLTERAMAAMGDEEASVTKAKTKKEKKAGTTAQQQIVVPTDVLHPELYRRLVSWRYRHSKEEGMPAYVILQQKALLGIVNLLPETLEQLKVVPYLGAKGISKYADELLALVNDYKANPVSAEPQPEVTPRPEPKRETTRAVSLRLFKEGKAVADIAVERQLAYSTIFSHLAQTVVEGELELEALVPADRVARVSAWLNAHDGQLPPYADFAGAFGEGIRYDEARLVRNVMFPPSATSK